MGQITKKVWKILLIVLGIASVTVLLTLMWHLLYYRTHYSSSKFAYNGNGRLLLEGGGEYDECISVKLEGNYFDHKMFYPDKDSIWVKADCNGRAVFDGYYYAGNMGDYAPDLMDPEDNAVLEEYNGRLAYADYRDKEQWELIFYLTDVSQIAENGKPGQKGLLVLASQDLFRPEEVVQKAILQSEKTERIRTEPVWENYIANQKHETQGR